LAHKGPLELGSHPSCLGVSSVASRSPRNHHLGWKGFLGREAKEKNAMLIQDVVS